MRELAATGFMSNRGRQNVASFLTQDLGVDWRWGAIWFEHNLLDHDVASNYGNWAAAAGVANKGQRINKFNMAKQAEQYDKDAVFIKTWVPEVAHLPPQLARAPWQASEGDEVDYPPPLVVPQYTADARGKDAARKKPKRWHKGKKKAFLDT
jgi:deoxyribodipyrimidine photo-lyase